MVPIVFKKNSNIWHYILLGFTMIHLYIILIFNSYLNKTVNLCLKFKYFKDTLLKVLVGIGLSCKQEKW